MCGRWLARTRQVPGTATFASQLPKGHWRSRPSASIFWNVARPPRDTRAGIFHVFTHCVWAAPALFRDDLDRTVFLRELARATRRYGWTCIEFCLMRTHYHLLLEVEDKALPVGMQSLNFRYAIGFNQRHGMRGHVQFERYGAKRMTSEPHLLTTFAYIANNPVEARLCDHSAQWPWSSYGGSVGLAESHSFVDPMRVLACFDSPAELAVAQLRARVEDA
jgi:putative transposase